MRCLFLLLPVLTAQEPSADELNAAIAAKVLASAVFVSGRDVDEALEQSVHPMLGVFGARAEDVTGIHVDRERKEVSVTLKGIHTGRARFYGDQGCVILPEGRDGVFFEPVALAPALPDGATTPWPMGDLVPEAPLSPRLDRSLLEGAVERAFDPRCLTAAFLVVHEGRIVAERYGSEPTGTCRSRAGRWGRV